jgi:hypothetical protein
LNGEKEGDDVGDKIYASNCPANMANFSEDLVPASARDICLKVLEISEHQDHHDLFAHLFQGSATRTSLSIGCLPGKAQEADIIREPFDSYNRNLDGE